jgi:hypothetical protein
MAETTNSPSHFYSILGFWKTFWGSTEAMAIRYLSSHRRQQRKPTRGFSIFPLG